MPSYKLVIAYDGTSYFGWQKTKAGPSIQGSLEEALQKVSREKMTVVEGASRTDRGVHAEGQVGCVFLQKNWTPHALQKALNSVLPSDIRILAVDKVPPEFHPTLDAQWKEYHYRICCNPFQEPIYRLYSWHVPKLLRLSLMERASCDLLGTRDFSAFSNEKTKKPLCTLSDIRVTPLEGNRLQISFRGNRFLYKMARNCAGTLIDIGFGKLSPNCIPTLFALRDRKRAGVTAPAKGLFLHRVGYQK